MSDFEKLQAQIEAQTINTYIFDVSFIDSKNEAFRLIHSDDGFYVWPLFFKPKKVTRAKAQILIRLATDFVKDNDVREFALDSKLTYDEFMNEFFNSTILSLADYIMINHDSKKAAFARENSVLPQQVTEWKNKKFIVVDDVLYSPRRELKKKESQGGRKKESQGGRKKESQGGRKKESQGGRKNLRACL